jgi:hypothetical protein
MPGRLFMFRVETEAGVGTGEVQRLKKVHD